MVGPVYGRNKEKLFRDCDIFVFPTYYDLEAFPLVNIEAMRAGIPVVSSNEGSIPEAVVDGNNGFIIDPKNVKQISNQVLKLVNNEKLRNEMGISGRKRYENYYTINAYDTQLNDGIKFFFKLANF
jgi:glycosyltransferase involved in cell wall biosynthesis